MTEQWDQFWSVPAADLLQHLGASARGLTTAEATTRLERFGANRLKAARRTGSLTLLLGQFRSPLILILLFAAVLSFFLHDSADAVIILVIVVASGVLSFRQERGAAHAVDKLIAVVETTAAALRDGTERQVPVTAIVPGDIVVLSAGKSVPGDCLVLESKDLYLDEATLTGETYPVSKTMDAVAGGAPLGQRTNTLFMGTHVVSGSATAVVVRTGVATEFGKISERLRLRPPETEFERKKAGHVVGYIGDGANFGNMFSMAGASLFLPFLPLLPKQILLTNLMTDFPEMTIATDSVDAEMVEQPRRWDTRIIRNFMMTFGLVSSVFDYATFGVLLLLGATADRFRTGWFLESVVSACLVVLVIRTRRPFFRSRPGRQLVAATILVIAATLVLPYTPAARILGFTPLPLWYVGVLGAILALYIIAAEAAKRLFDRGAGMPIRAPA